MTKESTPGGRAEKAKRPGMHTTMREAVWLGHHNAARTGAPRTKKATKGPSHPPPNPRPKLVHVGRPPETEEQGEGATRGSLFCHTLPAF